MQAFDLVTTVLTAAGGGAVLVAGLAAWLGKVWADRLARGLEASREIDVDLRERRIAVYEDLWKTTSLLPMWPRAKGVTYDDLYRFSEKLRDWYFQTGGLYLSRSTHAEAYRPLQTRLMEILDKRPAGVLKGEDYDAVRECCSTLRTALAKDIESRRESPR